MRDGHAVMSVMLRMNSCEAFEIGKGHVDGIHEMVENPISFGGIEVLGLDEVGSNSARAVSRIPICQRAARRAARRARTSFQS